MDKPQLRRQLQNTLLAIPDDQRAAKSHEACTRLISTEQFDQASVIMMYLSLPHEVDTSEAILHAWQQGKSVVVPKVSWAQRHMIAVEINSMETGISTSPSGLRNPITGEPMPLDEIDMVVTPALGFDRTGNRLGRGGAFYDRFFAHEKMQATRCGLAFSEQVMETIPVDEYDIPMNCLITDREILYFNNQQGD